jgi:HSP20 family protein
MPRPRFLAPFGASRVPARWGDPFADMQRGMNRVFDDVFHRFGVAPSDNGEIAAPRIDIDESERAIQISAELPGVPKDAVDVSIDNDVLIIRGEKRCERKDEQARVTERFYGTFQRAIQLPFPPDPDQVQASFENGVLKITLPKQDQPQTSHKIKVRTSGEEGQAVGSSGDGSGAQTSSQASTQSAGI